MNVGEEDFDGTACAEEVCDFEDRDKVATVWAAGCGRSCGRR